MSEMDVADVLKRYSEAINGAGSSISDASTLPYPKAIIKQVLVEGLRRFPDADTQNTLGNAFLALADFQDMTSSERDAVAFMESMSDPDQQSSARVHTLAHTIAACSASHRAVMQRHRAELKQLVSELETIQRTS